MAFIVAAGGIINAAIYFQRFCCLAGNAVATPLCCEMTS
jgi:hypothetical protein